ncbi:MAG TPA: hypothetical protein VKP88_05095 [Candidatus Paceibacterota bacterium]|nr:hypothetical protein [Candidatus Paceibacterota bacterium]
MSSKPKSLSQAEHEFARLIVYDGLVQAEAYRQAYGKPDYDDNTAKACASKAAKRPHVAAEIQRLRDELSEKSLWSRVDSINALKQVVTEPDKKADIIQAVAQLNKMFGWDKQTIEHTGPQGGPIQTQWIVQPVKPYDADSSDS